MNLIDKVKNSLKWKRSTYYCAAKLGISVEKYKELKRQLCKVYARCCGWLAPVDNFNKGLKAQYKDRKTYVVKKSQIE